MRGEQHRSAKLTEAEVRSILAQKGQTPVSDLALAYGVSTNNIWCIQTRRTWRGVKL